MKKWNNPELLSLGVESTFDGDCTCGVVGSIVEASTFKAKKNPCHKTGNGEHGGKDNVDVPGVGNGHIATSCDDHDYCCCYTVSPS